MAANQEVIKSFLVSLGFQVDEPRAKKFVGALLGAGKTAGAVTGAIAGVAAAAEAMVQTFARSMEKLYYTSRRTRSSVQGIMELQYAAEQVGVSAEDATGALEGMQRAIRLNPGLSGILRGLGVTGKEGTEQLYQLVESLSRMPHNIGAMWAQQFGMDEKTFFMLKDNLVELRDAEQRRREEIKASGIDYKAAAKASVEYQNSLRDLWQKVEDVWRIISVNMLPAFREFTAAARVALGDLVAWVAKITSSKIDLGEWGTQLTSIYENIRKFLELMRAEDPNRVNAFFWALGNAASTAGHGILTLVDAITAFLALDWDKLGGIFKGGFPDAKKYAKYGPSAGFVWLWDKVLAPESPEEAKANKEFGPKGQTSSGLIRSAPAQQGGSVVDTSRSALQAMADRAAKDKGVPEQILRALIGQESNWDPNATAKGSTAKGLGQLLKGTAKDLGVNNAFDPQENVQGVATYLRQMYDLKGNWRDALAAYNQGPNAPLTGGYGYADKILKNSGDVSIEQNNHVRIEVSSHGSAAETADAISSAQTRVNANALRDVKTAFNHPGPVSQ